MPRALMAAGGLRLTLPSIRSTSRNCSRCTTAPLSVTPPAGARTRGLSPAMAPTWMICGSTALAHAVFVRSPHAHARIAASNATVRWPAPACSRCWARRCRSRWPAPLRPSVEANVQTNEPFLFLPQPLLADDTVRYVGEPVVLVVAETGTRRWTRLNGCVIDYEPLPAVTQARDALRTDAPQLSDGCPATSASTGTGAKRRRPPRHPHSRRICVTIELNNHRIVTNPMEPRGAVGVYDGRYTLYLSSQNIHGNRDTAARVLGVDPSEVRFIAPDVGGGFGAKNFAYAEHALILWAARRTGRPVKWIATRSETFLSDHQARDHLADGHAGAGCGRQVPGAASGQHRQPWRLHGGRRGRRADQPVSASAGHGLPRSRHRAAGQGGADQHHADRRDPRARASARRSTSWSA